MEPEPFWGACADVWEDTERETKTSLKSCEFDAKNFSWDVVYETI